MGRASAETGGAAIRRRRFFTWRRLLGAFFGLCLLAMGAFFVIYLLVPVPSANAEATLQSNVYKFSNGKILARTGKVNREIVGLEKIPDDVEKTFVAAENKTFYEDSGVDVKGTARGLVNTVTGQGKQGGSTITQQYVKNYYLNQDQTVTRKLKELVISLKVDQQISKDDILAGYLNTSYYGRNAYGIQAAAQAYYRVDAEKLTVEQGAYLASVLQAPSQYDWSAAGPTGRTKVQQRWNYVLNNMVEEGWLGASERAGMTFPVPKEPKAAPGMEGQRGYIVEAANKELVEQGGITEAELKAGGWNITLNIDEKRQKSLEKAVKRRLEDNLDRKGSKVDATVQAGATSVDPKTGGVVALYGGVGATEHWLSNATRRDYQPASTFKPVVFASALENEARTQDGRLIGLDTVYDGTSRRPVVGSDVPFNPQNDLGISYDNPTVRTGLARSINSVFAQMIVDVGPKTAKRTGLDLGVPDGKDFTESPAASLGTMNASTWDMAGVYATLDNHGKKVTPSIVKSAERQGRAFERTNSPVGDQVISRQTADTVTEGLTGVVDNGSGFEANTPAFDAAGKTGTSENNKSAWFAGYTPELTTVVALFGERPDGSGQVSLTGTAQAGRANGGGFPARIWADYTKAALGGGSDARFDLDVADTVDPGGPAVSESPSEEPTESESPSDEPTESQSPSDEPTESQSPSDEPSTSESPSDEPTESQSPSDEPSDDGEPGDGDQSGGSGGADDGATGGDGGADPLGPLRP
ncbi:penicillin-binding protein [Streptomyces solincola]|uniref:Penicillin-binding protein n=1 Tax=Streptomyces solincola TaxID=2100817 RepID=A0A2S9PR46_9ACTN|nr:transglycosylase domain-containing protein [Streptomyces solincola]PRH76890.1 penicillin-binding protein [Streptomyces solincola]